jgi:UDP-N-acetylmuramoyl-tripeptide--D-alanyl-D-alanine ligase
VHGWTAERFAQVAGARLVAGGWDDRPPQRVVIDSRVASGDPPALFAGLPGATADGGSFAAQALRDGAAGVLVGEAHAEAAAAAGTGGAVLVAADPLAALQEAARAWRRELGANVVGITGSTGKTSTKDLLLALLAPQRRVHATRQNLNTEIGVPITILEAPAGTEVLVLEMAMRGPGQIAELARIGEPDVGIVVNVGPVHLELLGSIEAIAAAKAELLAGLEPGRTGVVPHGEPLLAPHLRDDLRIVTFGPGGDVQELPDGLDLGELAEHQRRNALAAVAAARAMGVEPAGRAALALSDHRGQRLQAGEVTVVDDCYNANPMSMRAALDDLAATAPGRRVAVLGDMRELGPDAERFHAQTGAHARERGVEVLVTVGELARHMGGDHHAPDAAAAAVLVPGLVVPGDTVLVKGSRGVGLEVVVDALAGAA